MFEESDLIFSYTRAQAIADGVLINLSERHPDICRQLYQFPIACTAAVWALVQQACNGESGRQACNDEAGVVWDLLWMSRFPKKRLGDRTVLYQVIIAGLGQKRTFTFKLVCGPGDAGEPVLTLMLPDED